MAFQPDDVISHTDICQAERHGGLQQGMNFRPNGRRSVILMSLRRGAPYADRLEDDGRVLIYEGHNVNRTDDVPDPRRVDQTDRRPTGSLTANGQFEAAAIAHRDLGDTAELVNVYEKIKTNIWTFNGVFRLVDAWREQSNGRRVFKFKLEAIADPDVAPDDAPREVVHTRMIPSEVKREVWKRDGARCVKCGATENLHFDHDIPYSKGGSSLTADNIQLLCLRHNLEKSDRIG